jgi:uncharacterized protein (DUF608 family)
MSMCLGLTMAGAAVAAPLSVGSVIGVDFGPMCTPNWNSFGQNTTLPAGDVRDSNGEIVDGLSLALVGAAFNNDGVGQWKASEDDLPVDLPDSVTGDIVVGTGLVTLTISGLDLDLAYNINALTAAKLAWDRIDTVNVIGEGAPLTSKLIRRQSSQAGRYHSFLNVRPNAKGVIQVKVTDSSGNSNPVINMVLIEPITKSEAPGSVVVYPETELLASHLYEEQSKLASREYEEQLKRSQEKIKELQSSEKLYPTGKRVHAGEYLTAVDFPVGSVGGSVIRLNGKAERQWWHIFNNFEERPDTGCVPNSFFAIRTEQGGDTEVRALQTSAVGAFQPMKSLTFVSEFPFGIYDFSDAALPVEVELEAYSFLIPMDLKNSAIPSAVFRYTVKNTSGSSVNVSLLAAQQNAVGFSGYDRIEGANNRSNPGYGSNRNKIIDAADRSSLEMTGDTGSMVLSAYANETSHTASWDSLDSLHSAFVTSGKLSGPAQASSPKAGVTVDGALAKSFTLAPGAEQTLTFVLSWHFPEGTFGRSDIPKWYFPKAGCQYENWFTDAADVDRYVFDQFDYLDGKTRLYRDSLYSSNLPRYVLDRVSSNIGVLKSPTTFWTKEGYFGIWESTSSEEIWFGNCKHVGHYAQGHARLFPKLDRKLRRQDLASMIWDGLLPSRDGEDGVAMDGHYGAILSLYRACLTSTNDAFAVEIWPKVKEAMDYAIRHYDPDRDGMLLGIYGNTLDGNAAGTSAWVGSLYLAALKASAQIAHIAGDAAKEEEYASIVKEGKVNQNEKLWDQDLGYYVERSEDLPSARFMGNGASIDMFLGQWWANQLGLGEIYPRERTLTALGHLYEGNLVTDDGHYRTYYRDFLGRDDSGWRMVMFPGKTPANSLHYHDEVMSGFEYSMAATLMQYGMLKDGLSVVRAIYDRYDGRLRAEGEVTMAPNATVFGTGSPVGEDECGDYYARALSSWSILLALQGFSYDGPKQIIGFKPVWQPEDHRSFFTAAEGWGVYSQQQREGQQTCRIHMAYGRLALRELQFDIENHDATVTVTVKIGKTPVAVESLVDGSNLRITLSNAIVLNAGDELIVSVH